MIDAAYKKSRLRILLAKLAIEGGCLISAEDCSWSEVEDAKARGDYYIDECGYECIRRPPEWLSRHSPHARNANPNNCEAE